MTKFFDLFPQELKDEVIDYRLRGMKKRRKANKRGAPLKTETQPKSTNFAFPRLRKLPLDTHRQVLSALNHFPNVAGPTEEERGEAFKKIIEKASSFEICTMGFRTKYSQYL